MNERLGRINFLNIGIMKRKRIEVLQPEIKTIGGELSFEELLDFCENKKYYSKLDCSYRFRIIERKDNLLIGMVITNQIKDLPPKEKIKTGGFSSLGLNLQEERLAYANVFLYDIDSKAFLYEVNKNGCHIDKLIELFYEKWREKEFEDRKIDIDFFPILREKNYERVMKFNFIKRFHLKIANPKEISENIEIENNSIAESIINHQLGLSKAANAEKLILELDAEEKRKGGLGLSRGVVSDLLNIIKRCAKRGCQENIKKIQVEGYEYSSEHPNRLQPIDLFVDTFKEFISLPDIKLHRNIQQAERVEQVAKLYNRIRPELKRILGA